MRFIPDDDVRWLKPLQAASQRLDTRNLYRPAPVRIVACGDDAVLDADEVERPGGLVHQFAAVDYEPDALAFRDSRACHVRRENCLAGTSRRLEQDGLVRAQAYARGLDHVFLEGAEGETHTGRGPSI